VVETEVEARVAANGSAALTDSTNIDDHNSIRMNEEIISLDLGRL
jgi:hypothetical protein